MTIESVSSTETDVLVMASHSLPGKYARKLEPWDLQNLVPFDNKYLSGFEAESFQITISDGFEEAKSLNEK